MQRHSSTAQYPLVLAKQLENQSEPVSHAPRYSVSEPRVNQTAVAPQEAFLRSKVYSSVNTALFVNAHISKIFCKPYFRESDLPVADSYQIRLQCIGIGTLPLPTSGP